VFGNAARSPQITPPAIRLSARFNPVAQAPDAASLVSIGRSFQRLANRRPRHVFRAAAAALFLTAAVIRAPTWASHASPKRPRPAGRRLVRGQRGELGTGAAKSNGDFAQSSARHRCGRDGPLRGSSPRPRHRAGSRRFRYSPPSARTGSARLRISVGQSFPTSPTAPGRSRHRPDLSRQAARGGRGAHGVMLDRRVNDAVTAAAPRGVDRQIIRFGPAGGEDQVLGGRRSSGRSLARLFQTRARARVRACTEDGFRPIAHSVEQSLSPQGAPAMSRYGPDRRSLRACLLIRRRLPRRMISAPVDMPITRPLQITSSSVTPLRNRWM
jgi:hypothetical protein